MWQVPKRSKKLIAGPGVYICDECIDFCTDIIQEDVAQSQSKATMESVPKPHEIKNHLDSYVIGPRSSEENYISVAVHNHYKRISKNISAKNGDVELAKV